MSIFQGALGAGSLAGDIDTLAGGNWPPQAVATLPFRESGFTTAANTPALIVGPSANRVYLAIFMPAGAFTTLLSTSMQRVTAVTGINITNTAPLVLNFSNNGTSVNQAWYIRCTAIQTFTVHEVFYQP